ncbi:MAG: hypothetical protein LBV22_03685 [Mycoplasmataceae bacterium]|nr:hypothetical protein [Mycoplasmataceae bacterium]
METLKHLFSFLIIIIIATVSYFYFVKVETTINCYIDVVSRHLIIDATDVSKIPNEKYYYKTLIRYEDVNYEIIVYSEHMYNGNKTWNYNFESDVIDIQTDNTVLLCSLYVEKQAILSKIW